MTISWEFPYPSARMPVLGRCVVATSQPLAAQAGLAMMIRGGNAVDAAVAAAIALTVVEPTSNGIGSDAFAIVWDGARLQGFNGSGRSPAGWTVERFLGKSRMPLRGWDAVTVPGAVDAWVRLHERYGKLPFEDLFEPAIRYAREGFFVSPITAAAWAASVEPLKQFEGFARTFLPAGRAPRAGERFSCPAQAQTLERIAHTRGDAFYRGELSAAIAEHARAGGGAMREEDLASHQGEWVDTISQPYRGYTLHEIPPNGQGLAALIALGILEHLPVHPVDSAEAAHQQIEAMKLAFADAEAHVCDPAHAPAPVASLLDPAYLSARAQLIQPDRALRPATGVAREHGTVYLTTADAGGMMVSMIQSNFYGFGSGIVVNGISMQNRGFGFVLDPKHPNCVGPAKRPYHTIIPAFITTADNQSVASFGVMGGHMQPQGHVQVMTRLVDHGQNPQAALDAPRWFVQEDLSVALEPRYIGLSEELRRRGHTICETAGRAFGGGQVIWRMDGGYCAASDPRKDGQAVGM